MFDPNPFLFGGFNVTFLYVQFIFWNSDLTYPIHNLWGVFKMICNVLYLVNVLCCFSYNVKFSIYRGLQAFDKRICNGIALGFCC